MKGERESQKLDKSGAWTSQLVHCLSSKGEQKKRSCQNSMQYECITLFTISYGPTTPISVCITPPLPSKGNDSKWKNMKRGHNALQAIHKYRHMHNM